MAGGVVHSGIGWDGAVDHHLIGGGDERVGDIGGTGRDEIRDAVGWRARRQHRVRVEGGHGNCQGGARADA